MGAITGLRWACWPAPDDLLLLQAAAHHDDQAAARAWQLLRGRLDVDRPTSEQYRLLPLLSSRLATIAPDDALAGLLRGIARRHTVHNLVLLGAMAEPVGLLRAAGIEPVVLKGPALALGAYRHVGLRPFQDVDLLVRPGQHAAARRTLEAAGWEAKTADFAGNHAVPLSRPDLDIDLHRQLNRELVVPGRPDDSWDLLAPQLATQALPDGTGFTTLDAAGHLVHAVAHGTQLAPVAHPVTNLRWVADAGHLIATGTVDWDRVVTLATTMGVAPVLTEGLTLVTQQLGAAVPAAILGRLRSVRTGPLADARTRAFRVPTDVNGRLGGLPRTTAVFLQRTSDRTGWATVGALPSFLASVWGLESPAGLPRELWHRSRTAVSRPHAGSVDPS
jgi:hypothetical protein